VPLTRPETIDCSHTGKLPENGRKTSLRQSEIAKVFLAIDWQGRHMAVPLSQLLAIRGDEATNEVIADWHYWVAQSHCF
jgi:hypothetical protein